VAFLDPTSNRQVVDSLEGSFDGFEGLYAVGWAHDEAKGDIPVSLDVLANNRWVRERSCRVAPRDLVDAKIGDGTHGFKIPLPVELCDGGRYEICVRAGEGAIALHPGVRIFQRNSTLAGHVDGLDGLTLLGGSATYCKPNEAAPVELLIGRAIRVTGLAAQPRRKDSGFTKNTAVLYGGRPHVVSVQVTGTIFLVGEIAIVIPAVSTPVDALRRYNGSFANAALIEGAPARYEALRRQIQFLVNEDNHLSDEE